MTTTTSSTKKLTKRDHFNALLTIPEVANDPILVDFINNELNLLTRKNATDKKPTALQQANETMKDAIMSFLANGEMHTVSSLIKNVSVCADCSNQKVSALMIQLVNENRVEKVIEKRVTYFKAVKGE